MLLMTVVLVISLGTIEAGIFSQPAVAKVHVVKGYCDGYKNLTSGLQNISLRTDSSRRTFMNSTIVVGEDAVGDIYEEVTVIKCKSKDSPDSCTNFKSLKFPNACGLLTAKNQIWSTMFSSLTPKMECPIRKGRYEMVNGYYDLSKCPIPLEMHSFWKLTFKFFDVGINKMTMCYYCEGTVLPLKKL